MSERIVIALGGNALGKTPSEQLLKVKHAARPLCDLIEGGYEIVISHGNGPQVGMIDLAFATACEIDEKIPHMPLAECTAMSQGYIGYHLQGAILSEMRSRGMPWHAATVITRIEVDRHDPAFKNPTKPIGPYYSKEDADKLMHEYKDLYYAEDSGRGYRRMVASPEPIDIVEKEAILDLLKNEFVVIACGGGGIPVIREADGTLCGSDAVIDKDFAAARLGELTGADTLIILTAVERVALNYGKENEKQISEMTVDEAEKYCSEGHFAPGSMLPKVNAAIDFVKSKKGRRAIIASLENAALALSGESGTTIY
ncbi:MAG: carbamate kinase [Clostridia bacterium]|nr:carbamate kinase [Clostridia bacterium]